MGVGAEFQPEDGSKRGERSCRLEVGEKKARRRIGSLFSFCWGGGVRHFETNPTHALANGSASRC